MSQDVRGDLDRRPGAGTGPGGRGDRDERDDATSGGGGRRSGELTARELARWTWRQLTSMRTALVLLLLLALAAVPGSVIPQEAVDSLAVTRWKEQHTELTPIYERLGLFAVYESPWFSAIYLLLVTSLVGCIVPRLFVYARGLRAQPPAAPKRLDRMPLHTTWTTDEAPEVVLERARAVLRRKRYRLRTASGRDGAVGGRDAVSAERGYLREAGNLLFHLAVLVVLAGFAVGSMFGYQGGVIVRQGDSFTNTLTQYDDFAPGSMFGADDLEPFCFDVDTFDVEWLESGPRQGQAQGFDAGLSYRADCRSGSQTAEQNYDLRVNHPLGIGDTDVFLIGHGYAPQITVRDGDGDVVSSEPVVFLPQDPSFLSFGVVKPPSGDIGLEGLFYPTYLNVDGDPVTVMGDDRNPTISMLAYTGDLGLDNAQSVYTLDKSNATQLTKPDGSPLRIDLQPGQTARLPDGLGSVTFDGVTPWVRLQISQSPGKGVALGGVVLALIGLCMSLFIRPRRVWVRARAAGGEGAQGTMVEVALLDRSGGGDLSGALADVEEAVRGAPPSDRTEEESR